MPHGLCWKNYGHWREHFSRLYWNRLPYHNIHGLQLFFDKCFEGKSFGGLRDFFQGIFFRYKATELHVVGSIPPQSNICRRNLTRIRKSHISGTGFSDIKSQNTVWPMKIVYLEQYTMVAQIKNGFTSAKLGSGFFNVDDICPFAPRRFEKDKSSIPKFHFSNDASWEKWEKFLRVSTQLHRYQQSTEENLSFPYFNRKFLLERDIPSSMTFAFCTKNLSFVHLYLVLERASARWIITRQGRSLWRVSRGSYGEGWERHKEPIKGSTIVFGRITRDSAGRSSASGAESLREVRTILQWHLFYQIIILEFKPGRKKAFLLPYISDTRLWNLERKSV